MKVYRQCKTDIVLVLLWFLIAGFAHQTVAAADANQTVRSVPAEEIPTILDLIANGIRENYERINTWTGEIDKKITWVHTGSLVEELLENAADRKGDVPETLLQKAQDKITFAVDTNNNFVYVDTLRDKPSTYFNYNTGTAVGNSGPSPIWSTIIAKPDFLLKADAQSFEKGTGRLIHKKAEKKLSKQKSQRSLYEGRYDPRKAFFPGADFTWDTLDRLIARLEKYGKIAIDGYTFKMEEYKRGDNIEYEIIEPTVMNLERTKPEHYVILTMVFSSQYGFNMTSFEAANGSGTVFQKFTWEYELTDSVYVPKRVIMKLHNVKGEVTDEYDSTYKNNKVNQEISSDTFEISNLKLMDGDVFIDEIANKKSVYKKDTDTLEEIRK
jgi:hypothetical protein